ncbi:hypothetical protein HDV05_000670 [Chytridiales sp. JEL 0842]|nr:hypothetical protein HDV05_000670 [Chytridiales sp. JEL 0842]
MLFSSAVFLASLALVHALPVSSPAAGAVDTPAFSVFNNYTIDLGKLKSDQKLVDPGMIKIEPPITFVPPMRNPIFEVPVGAFIKPCQPSDDVVYSSIGVKYRELGGRNGGLGCPLDATETPTAIGMMRYFRYGAMYWRRSDNQVFAVYGDIYHRYRELNEHNGYLGFPTSSEQSTEFGNGRFNTFENGAIRWHPSTGYKGMQILRRNANGGLTPQSLPPFPGSGGQILRRQLIAQGRGSLVDDETFGSDEYGDFDIRGAVYNIDDLNPSGAAVIGDGCAGDEVRAVIKMEWELLPSIPSLPLESVRVIIKFNLYEGTSCSTTDFEDYRQLVLTLEPGSRNSLNFVVPGNGGGSGTATVNLNYNAWLN